MDDSLPPAAPPGGRKGDILRPKEFGGAASLPPGVTPPAGSYPPALLPPYAAEAMYYEGMAAYQRRNWPEALSRFTLVQRNFNRRARFKLPPIEEVRWFLQLDAAAPVGGELSDAPECRGHDSGRSAPAGPLAEVNAADRARHPRHLGDAARRVAGPAALELAALVHGIERRIARPCWTRDSGAWTPATTRAPRPLFRRSWKSPPGNAEGRRA